MFYDGRMFRTVMIIECSVNDGALFEGVMSEYVMIRGLRFGAVDKLLFISTFLLKYGIIEVQKAR